MSKSVYLIFADGHHIKQNVPATQDSVVFPADTSLHPPVEMRAKIEQIVHKEKTYWFARQSQQAISIDRVKCVILGID